MVCKSGHPSLLKGREVTILINFREMFHALIAALPSLYLMSYTFSVQTNALYLIQGV